MIISYETHARMGNESAEGEVKTGAVDVVDGRLWQSLQQFYVGWVEGGGSQWMGGGHV